MLKSISYDSRRMLLVAGAGLVVSFVRNVLQYHQYGWESLGEFALSVLIHSVAIAIFAVVAAVATSKNGFFLGDYPARPKMDIEEMLVFVCKIAIAASVCIFFIAHWPESDGLE